MKTITAYHATLENIILSPEHFNSYERVENHYLQICSDLEEKPLKQDMEDLYERARKEYEDYIIN